MPAKSSYAFVTPRFFVPLLAIVSSVALTACGTPNGSGGALNPVNWLTPYKVDVIQGNFISKEQVEALQPGMPRSQVKELLGTPLIASIFHADRWDYVFTLKRQGVPPQAYRYTVFFKDDVLERSAGDAMPSEAEFIAQLNTHRKRGKVPVLEATAEQLKAAEKSAPRASTPAPAGAADASGAATAQPAAPATAYPPLESPRQ